LPREFVRAFVMAGYRAAGLNQATTDRAGSSIGERQKVPPALAACFIWPVWFLLSPLIRSSAV
jgi:hypothetical protein